MLTRSDYWVCQSDECLLRCYVTPYLCVVEDLHLPMGVFLMLGFSEKEEALMRNATGNGVAEAIPSLQHLFRSIAHSLGVSVLRPGLLKEGFGSCIKSLLRNITFKERCSCG